MEEDLSCYYTEEAIHLLILDKPEKFGLKEIKESSFRSTPDIVAIDKQGKEIKIELELKSSGFIPHIKKGQVGKITHCWYLDDDWARMKDTVFKKPDTVIFNKIYLDKEDEKYLDTEIYERLEVKRGIKNLIEIYAFTNYTSKEFKVLDILINQYFLEVTGKTIKEFFDKKHVFPSYNEIKEEILKFPRQIQIRLILDYNKYLECFFLSRPIFFSERLK